PERDDAPGPDSGPDAGSDIERDEGADREPQEEPPPRGPLPPAVGDLYIVLDDAGYSMRDLEPFLELDIPLTISVLPHLQYSADAARAAVRSGHDVMLHMPMEARGSGNPGTGAIRVTHGPQEILSRLHGALDSVPFAVAANNHMGSAVTEQLLLMQVIVEGLHERGLFFLDSRTTADTTVAQAGNNVGIQTVERHVFIDHDRDVDSMRGALRAGIERARVEGYAVLIGHVQTPELPELLTWAAREAAEAGVVFRPISHMGVRYAGLRP
ncbi:MAG: divergent polysaccharide deacetylase family protein, partial [Spirochaetaceae bacterium]